MVRGAFSYMSHQQQGHGDGTSIYRNNPKFSDRYAWANSADPDQTAPRSSLIWVCSV